jgi:tryptophan synthase alpha chain
MPYITLGYPTPQDSLACVEAAVAAGADLIELGVPFSDPLAVGPAVQHSTQIALENGITPKQCIEMVAELRKRGVTIPLLLMGYYNPIYAYGLNAYAHDAAQAGADGFIVPDLPMEEAAELQAACQANGLDLIPMIAPTSTPARIQKAAASATGFIYLVSVTGVTGERSTLADGLKGFVGQVKEATKVPVAVGFGISTPAQAAEVGAFADGVIIGSAVIKAMGGEQPAARVGAYLREIKSGLS